MNRLFGRFSVELDRQDRFEVSATVRSCNGFSLSRFVTRWGNARLIRGTGEIVVDARDAYVFAIQFRGESEVTQFGRTQRRTLQQMGFISMADPLLYTKFGCNDACFLSLPREFVDQRMARAENYCGRALNSDGPLQRLTHDAITSFADRVPGMTDAEFHAAARVLGELFARSGIPKRIEL